MSKLRIMLSLVSLVMSLPVLRAANHAWPVNYEGVMLQAFSWDSYSDTKWTNLKSQADELSRYFNLIWIPNSGKSSGGMGYMPMYWFTNHNSAFGTETELTDMISDFKTRGTGFIADVVVNHRVGVSNWTDFPAEQWNGTTWKIGPEGICSTDEVKDQPGQARPTGAPDTGDDFNGARDLDHTNANVQNNVKNYDKCLLEKYGYVGFRYDMVKGYAGRFTKIYNEYSKPTYSVGEYWDASYDAVAAWIESTGRQSAAFDFPLKYQLNKAFPSQDSYNLTELVWRANGTTDQPAGMIHFGYQQYSVTFVDNHDTYRDGSKFNGNVLAANAFILCSPGTPCIFLPHWKQYKADLKKIIDARNAAGVNNMSKVNVLKTSANCYLAEIIGSKSTLAVRIGTTSEIPSGYTDADIKARGDGYCVWTKASVQGDDEPDDMPASLYVIGTLDRALWETSSPISMTRDGNTFKATGVNLVNPGDGDSMAYFTFITTSGSDWDAVNASDRYGAISRDELVSVGTPARIATCPAGAAASGAYSWKVTPGIYDMTVDFSNMTLRLSLPGEHSLDTTVAEYAAAGEVYYTLQGIRVNHPERGVYIAVSGSKARKIFIP